MPCSALSSKLSQTLLRPRRLSVTPARAERFPRSTDLPSQSPLFWVEQKDRYLRQLLIRDIEEITGRRLVVYFANRFDQAEIDARDALYMTEVLVDVSAGQSTDVLIETPGGQTDATEALISAIQSHVSDFRTIVAKAAKSNGTLLCLAARSIVMGASSELGPIEPSVQGIPCSVLTDPEIAKQNFALHKFGQFALQQSRDLAKKLLTAGMMRGRTPDEIEQTVQKLSSRDVYYSHGSVVNHQEAVAIGLSVEYLDPSNDLWKRIWLLYCMYDHDCQKSKYLKLFEGRILSTAVAAPPGQPHPPRLRVRPSRLT